MIDEREAIILEMQALEGTGQRLNDGLIYPDDADIEYYELSHYGTKYHSGRYPYGSGEDPYQHDGWLKRCKQLEAEAKKNGEKGESTVAQMFGMTLEDYRGYKSLAKEFIKDDKIARAKALSNKGYGATAIAKKMSEETGTHIGESTVRNYLSKLENPTKEKSRKVAELIAEQVREKGCVDVGEGVELELGVSQGKLKNALLICQAEYGMGVGTLYVPQQFVRGANTSTLVIAKDEATFEDTKKDLTKLQPFSNEYTSRDNGETFRKIQYPASIDSKRIAVRYLEDGGKENDGLIEIRDGVKDLDLGNSHYAQVRILVDDKLYVKGMAVRSDRVPEGYDILVNSNKPKGTPMEKVLKKIKDDPENPFGAAIKPYSKGGQYYYTDKDGKEKLGAINKLNEEGDFNTSSALNLSSQFLSKQPEATVRRQLDLTYADKLAQFEEIKAITNPTVKRKELLDYAESLDAAVLTMKAKAMPGQSRNVLLPVETLKDGECYFPNGKDGEKYALIRYPHGHISEIPILTNNTKNKLGEKIVGKNSLDAIGINMNAADKLSGADFDGDTCIVIPVNSRVKIKNAKTLKGLEGFDTKDAYGTVMDSDGVCRNPITGKKVSMSKDKKNPNEMVTIQERYKNIQMGVVSNLLNDMNLLGAPDEEVAQVLKHSMVIIDSYKHRLDWKQSAKDNHIKQLQEKWQGGGGASTIISQRNSMAVVPERKGSPRITEDGMKVWKNSGRTYEDVKKVVDKETGITTYVPTGKGRRGAHTKVNAYAVSDDLMEFVSDYRNPKELRYAEYGNKLKALAREVRKEYVATPRMEFNRVAAIDYAKEVAELDAALKTAQKKKPKNRIVNAYAEGLVRQKKADNPYLETDSDALKKVKTNALNTARAHFGVDSKATEIHITDRQWEAIQAGALHDSTVEQILRFANQDEYKALARPKETKELPAATITRLESMKKSGMYTNKEIAQILGISTSTISKYTKA